MSHDLMRVHTHLALAGTPFVIISISNVIIIIIIIIIIIVIMMYVSSEGDKAWEACMVAYDRVAKVRGPSKMVENA